MKEKPELDPLRPRPELDFSKGERGRYVQRMSEGSNVALIEPDLLDTFPDSESVNAALRSLKQLVSQGAPPAAKVRINSPSEHT